MLPTPADPRTRPPSTTPPPEAEVEIRARRKVVRRLGDWTNASRLDVLASSGLVVLDLLLPRIEAEEIDVRLRVDRGLVVLLVPDDARILDEALRWTGRGRLRDRTGSGSPDGRIVRLGGEVRRGDVRVRRGGIAILTLMRHGRAGDVRRAFGDGRLGGARAR